VFIGRTDVEAETPILWPLDADSCPQTSNSTKCFSKAFLKARWVQGEGEGIGCCRHLGVGILCSYNCPVGHLMMFQ